MFGGETYDHERDAMRLGLQLRRVKYVLLDEQWHTLAELAEYAGCSVASASARVRDLRKRRFGSYTIERQYLKDGVWLYRLVP